MVLQFSLRTCLLAAFIVIVATPTKVWSAFYTVTDLGSLVAPDSIATAINSTGQVTGTIGTSSNIPRAFLYSAGTMSALGGLGGPSSYSYGVAINDKGDVVGNSATTSNATPQHAFLYSQSKLNDLGSLTGASGGSSAFGINNTGVVVGTSTTASGATHAFSYSNGKMNDLGSLVAGGNSFASAVNNEGHIAGAADLTNNRTGTPQHAIFYDGTYHDLGTLGTGINSLAYAINKKDEVVGYSEIAPNTFPIIHAYIDSAGKMIDLGTLGGTRSAALAINDLSQVVGFSTLAGPQTGNHAFLFANGSMTDLNTLIDPSSGWSLIAAEGINSSSQIVGYGINSRGQTHAFLLTPFSVPEPGSVVLMAIGVVAAAGWRFAQKSTLNSVEVGSEL